MDVAGEAGTISAVAVCSESDEKYVVLIFVDGLDMKEQMILEDILSEIGRNNNMDNFPAKLPFDEANMRLVNFNKATKQKQDKVPSADAAATRLSSFPRANPIGVQVFEGGGGSGGQPLSCIQGDLAGKGNAAHCVVLISVGRAAWSQLDWSRSGWCEMGRGDFVRMARF